MILIALYHNKQNLFTCKFKLRFKFHWKHDKNKNISNFMNKSCGLIEIQMKLMILDMKEL